MLAFICLTQLIFCIVAEWKKMKRSSILHACRITTQKVLYFITFLASLIRGTYFISPVSKLFSKIIFNKNLQYLHIYEQYFNYFLQTAFKISLSKSLLSAYYPLILSGSSLIVCFWAEAFHLKDIQTDKPQFLSKSFLAFIVFNFITYSLLLLEVVTVQLSSQNYQV